LTVNCSVRHRDRGLHRRGGNLEIIASIEDPLVIAKILSHRMTKLLA